MLEFDECLKLANEFLATKERKNYYEFQVIDYESDYAYYSYELSDEEVEKIRQLKVKYPEDYGNHLDEVFDDPDVVEDYSGGEDLVSIDTDNILHKYKFMSHEIRNDKTTTTPMLIILTDEEYARLLAWHLYDEHLTVNTLYYRDEALYKKIRRGVDWQHSDGMCIMCCYPYTVSMDEALEDAEEIRKIHNIKKSGGLVGIFI